MRFPRRHGFSNYRVDGVGVTREVSKLDTNDTVPEKRSYCITSWTESIIEAGKDESWKPQDKNRGKTDGFRRQKQ